ncbi:MAG: asparagine synthase (glutamine-hydrolyzing) [Candidatus Andersenbacteria bacterium]
MCGITGKVSFGSSDITTADIDRMNKAVAHRGPDDAGMYISPDHRVGLGHRRLAILDLTSAGRQPMRYRDRYVIVFNGEIYNFQQKREELEKEGYRFKSHTDTEVILALYDKYKEGCLRHLRGMFAFAIYDEQKQTLFCARDRVGKKPFKYYWGNDVFVFASELKAILTQSEYQREPDYLAIHHYLSLQYVPAPLTGFKDIRKLKPGHFLQLDIKKQKLTVNRYWQLDFRHKQTKAAADWKKEIIDKLDEATQLRLIADVPLGAFLSGGIDSSAVVALMSRHSAKPVKTFSIGFEEAGYNELPFARMVAKKFKTDHTEFIVRPETIDILPELVGLYEEPYADSSALPTYYLSKLTRQHVTVALNGDGGDENFAGYPWYGVQKFTDWYQKLLPLHKLTAAPATRVISRLYPNTFTDRMLRFAHTLDQPTAARYLNYICYFTDVQKSDLYGPQLRHFLKEVSSAEILAEHFAAVPDAHPVDEAQYVDINTYLPDDLLVKVDIATMAVALEGRSPFLDHEFLELSASIPANLKLRGLNTKKYILKQALHDILPDEVLYRPKKGFGVPIGTWFRSDLKNYLRSVVLSPRSLSRGLFEEEAIQRLIATHNTTTINHAPRLWALLTLELWWRRYFDSQK